MKLKKLSAQDFDRIAAQTRMEERTKQLAREVLVDGEAPTDVAARAGMTKQRISLAVGVIEKAYFASTEGGLGWVALELELPEVIALQLDEVFQQLRNSSDQAKLEEAAQIIKAALKKTSHLLS
jgi:hypothetical protein